MSWRKHTGSRITASQHNVGRHSPLLSVGNLARWWCATPPAHATRNMYAANDPQRIILPCSTSLATFEPAYRLIQCFLKRCVKKVFLRFWSRFVFDFRRLEQNKAKCQKSCMCTTWYICANQTLILVPPPVTLLYLHCWYYCSIFLNTFRIQNSPCNRVSFMPAIAKKYTLLVRQAGYITPRWPVHLPTRGFPHVATDQSRSGSS